MKINRFIALAAIALLVVGAMGAIATRSFALGSHNPVASVSAQANACTQDQADGAEVASATDTDNIDLQCGDQNAPDTGVEAADGQETVGAADTDNVNVEEQVGDQSGPDTSVEAPESTAPAGK
ncbi:MAG: hypothetical protein HY258_00840 [Chloroflexi bacterium]|nr:hypothetical protein [Chloroflexota bacterium]